MFGNFYFTLLGRDLFQTSETDSKIEFKVGSIDESFFGLRERGINEIYGEAGVGKTQICL